MSFLLIVTQHHCWLLSAVEGTSCVQVCLLFVKSVTSVTRFCWSFESIYWILSRSSQYFEICHQTGKNSCVSGVSGCYEENCFIFS